MKTRITCCFLFALALTAFNSAAAPGTVAFANHNGSKVINGQTGNPITAADNVRVALYWSALGTNDFVQIGAATNIGVPVPGVFAGGMRTCGAATPGRTAGQFQVRAWAGGYATYEQALANAGVLIGQSAIIEVVTGDPAGDPPMAPGSLLSGGFTGFSLQPNPAPPLTVICPSNKVVNCGSAWSFDPPMASGGCGPIPTISVMSTVTNGFCPQLVTRFWQITDGCATNTCNQQVTVVDITPPLLVCASNRTVECGSAWEFDAPTASDECSGTNLTLSVLDTTTSGVCPQVFTRTWLAIDACNNSNTCAQGVTVVDTTPPLLLCASNKIVECGSAWDFDVPTASDACSGTNVTLSILDTTTNGVCPQIFARTWLAVDGCNNSNTCTQVVTVVDTTPPILVCASNKTVECGSAWEFDAPAASDACSGTNIVVSVLDTTTNGIYPQAITRTWLATDGCNNSNTCAQIVTVVDSSALVALCGSNKVVSCDTNWDFDLPVVTSGGCSTNAAVIVLDTLTNSYCPQRLTRTWSVTNVFNGASTLCAQTVTVLCSNCPVLAVTKECPPNPVPPGGLLAFTGTVTNLSDLALTNVVVLNDKPTPGTLVFGPVALAPGQSAAFTGSYTVSAIDSGPFTDTLVALGTTLDGLTFSNSVTASCPRATVIIPGDSNGDGTVDQAELDAVLANYWPRNPWLLLTNAAGLGGANVSFALSNSTAGAFSVEYSTNLTDWQYLGPAIPRYEFTDTNAPALPERYYRLRWP